MPVSQMQTLAMALWLVLAGRQRPSVLEMHAQGSKYTCCARHSLSGVSQAVAGGPWIAGPPICSTHTCPGGQLHDNGTHMHHSSFHCVPATQAPSPAQVAGQLSNPPPH